jgi:hypothetical protein
MQKVIGNGEANSRWGKLAVLRGQSHDKLVMCIEIDRNSEMWSGMICGQEKG